MRKTFWQWFVDKFDNFVEKIGCLRTCLQKTRLRDNREKFSDVRVIYLNNKKPPSYHGDEPLKYKSNRIKTSKYTLYNFLPKNLWEQFRRVANFYFLINLIILFVIPDPPINPFANAIPLLIVIGLTAAKQAYEDVIRHRADREFNSKLVRVIRDGNFATIKSKEIQCGDIVEVPLDQTFPCDLLLLYSKHDNNTCHVKTSNLDGETNLKARTVPHSFPMFESEYDLMNICGVVTCEKPNSRLYDFKGKLLYEGKEYLISNENILLRGTHLKIASTIYGCAIYTGGDTKMMLNSRFKSNKLSCVERRLNYYIASTIFIILFISVGCLVGAILFNYIYGTHWYLWKIEPVYFYSNPSLYLFDTYIFFINLNYFIPLSLYVTLELTRFFGSRFFEWDMEMYDERTDQPAKVNATDLNEDLGQIEYLFSDKTGTLTENEMLFKKFSIMGRTFSDHNGDILEDGSDIPEDQDDGKLKRFLEALSVCHTVQIDNTTDEKYNASSPDELSFIKFCQKVGINFEGDEIVRANGGGVVAPPTDGNTTNRSMANSMILRKVVYDNKYENKEKIYEILHTLEFDSERKRMSVLVRDRQRNEYVLFCKGADSSMMERCVCKSERFYEQPLNSFSENGWRVIVIAYRILSEYEYKQYDSMLADATGDIVNRDVKLAHAFDAIESRLHILGVTAVEDKLQEDVEITLSELRQAGIKIWVLTGDKLETAMNISDSCRHFSSDMHKFIMKGMKNSKEIEERFIDIKDIMMKNENDDLQSYALIIDGETLANLVDADLNETFKEIALKCDSVLCCRMSPSQKAFIVKMVKHSRNNPMTAAIGDGANDVSMIQEAHVGFGIFGKEGRNAAISSDFCFAKFKYLKRALLVHGYLYYTRASILVLYFFYQNMVFNICPLYYTVFTAFSASSIFPSLFQSFYNVVLTSNCPFVFALFEQHTSIDKLETNPFYYRTIARNKFLSTFQFVKWLCLGLWHSSCAFFLPVGIFSINEVLTSDGRVLDYITMGELILVLVLLFVHIKICLIWNCWNNQVPLALLGDFIGFVIICLVFSAFIIPDFLTIFTNQQSIYFAFFILFSSGSVWFFIAVATVIAMSPDLIIGVLERLSEDTKLHKLMTNFGHHKTSALPSRSNTPTSSSGPSHGHNSRDNHPDRSMLRSRPTTTTTASTSTGGGRRVTYVPPVKQHKVVPKATTPTPIRIQPVRKTPTVMATKMKANNAVPGNSIRLKKTAFSDSEESHPRPRASMQIDKTRAQTAAPPGAAARKRTTSRNFDQPPLNSVQI